MDKMTERFNRHIAPEVRPIDIAHIIQPEALLEVALQVYAMRVNRQEGFPSYGLEHRVDSVDTIDQGRLGTFHAVLAEAVTLQEHILASTRRSPDRPLRASVDHQPGPMLAVLMQYAHNHLR